MLETNRPDEPEVVTADLRAVSSEPTISYDDRSGSHRRFRLRISKGPSRILAALLGGLLVAGASVSLAG